MISLNLVGLLLYFRESLSTEVACDSICFDLFGFGSISRIIESRFIFSRFLWEGVQPPPLFPVIDFLMSLTSVAEAQFTTIQAGSLEPHEDRGSLLFAMTPLLSLSRLAKQISQSLIEVWVCCFSQIGHMMTPVGLRGSLGYTLTAQPHSFQRCFLMALSVSGRPLLVSSLERAEAVHASSAKAC